MRAGIVDEGERDGYDWEAGGEFVYAPAPEGGEEEAGAHPRGPSASVGVSPSAVRPPPAPAPAPAPRPVATPTRRTAYQPAYGFDRAPSASISTQPSYDDAAAYETPVHAIHAVRSPELVTAPSHVRGGTLAALQGSGMSSDPPSGLRGPLRGPPGAMGRLGVSDSQLPMFTPGEEGSEPVPTAAYGGPPSVPPHMGVYGFDGQDSESVGLTPSVEPQLRRY